MHIRVIILNLLKSLEIKYFFNNVEMYQPKHMAFFKYYLIFLSTLKRKEKKFLTLKRKSFGGSFDNVFKSIIFYEKILHKNLIKII